MSQLKRTQLYDVHVAAGATMVDFGGWEMPIKYPTDIVAEHLYTRHFCSLFDVSHMGRILVDGPQAVAFLQHVLSSNVLALGLNQAQYAILPNETGGAVDDAYLYRYEADRYLLVVNASNTEKDLEHLNREIRPFDARMTVISDQWAAIALQGPQAKAILQTLAGGGPITEPVKNALNTLQLEGRTVRVAKTGYTGEPLGYEIYVPNADAVWLWERLAQLGARPAGLGARDTLRLEAGLPLYGHEMGLDPDGREIPIYSVPLARFAVSFAPHKGEFIGRKALEEQYQAFCRIENRDFSQPGPLTRRIFPIVLTGRGVMRAGMPVYRGEEHIGYVTSGTMVPYFTGRPEEGGDSAMRSIGLALLSCDVLTGDQVEVDVRGRRIAAAIPPTHLRGNTPPYARPVLWPPQAPAPAPEEEKDGLTRALTLLTGAAENCRRRRRCLDLQPGSGAPSPAVELLRRSAGAENLSPDQAEQAARRLLGKLLGCAQADLRTPCGQAAAGAVFSGLTDFKNRLNRKRDMARLGYVLTRHPRRGGLACAQPSGALHDCIAVDPVTERSAMLHFPLAPDGSIDLEQTGRLLEQYRPELIVFGSSAPLHREPVAAVKELAGQLGLSAALMYDAPLVLDLLGDRFQNPLAEGAELITGGADQGFFGPRLGVIAGSYRPGQLKMGLWNAIRGRTAPACWGAPRPGDLAGLLMALYEADQFRDGYQAAALDNARRFAQALKAQGLEVADSETHLLALRVAEGPGVARRLADSGLLARYLPDPDEEGMGRAGTLLLGVGGLTRLGFGPAAFDRLAELLAHVLLRGGEAAEEVAALAADAHPAFCFAEGELDAALAQLAAALKD